MRFASGRPRHPRYPEIPEATLDNLAKLSAQLGVTMDEAVAGFNRMCAGAPRARQVDPRTEAMADWDERFEAWSRSAERLAMPIWAEDEFCLWSPGFTDDTVADRKRWFQGLPPRRRAPLPESARVAAPVFQEVDNPMRERT